MFTVKVFAEGESLCIPLPPEVVKGLGVKLGEKLTLTDTAQGFELIKYDDELTRQMEVAEEVMRRNRDLLRKLAE